MLPLFLFLILGILIIILFLYQNNRKKTLQKEEIGKENLEEQGEKDCPSGAIYNHPVLPTPDDPNYPQLGKIPLKQRGYSGDCYLFPGICPTGTYCQLDDRIRWSKDEEINIRGRCVSYQKECYSCMPTAEDYLINLDQLPAFNGRTSTPGGTFTERAVVCQPGLICTGDTIPDLPPTCVQKRPPDRRHPPTREEMIQWSLRFVRLGGRLSRGLDLPCAEHRNDGICIRYKGVKTSPNTKGASQEDLIKTTNYILKVLWPVKKLGPFPGPFIPGKENPEILHCEDPEYEKLLTDYQKREGGKNYRTPIQNLEINEREGLKDAPPCLYQNDFGYNDEGPSIWGILHTASANLPQIITEEQYSILRIIPSFLQQFQSCELCRSQIRNHLFRIKMPESRNQSDWFRYFWNCHNYISSQTTKTRAGSDTGRGSYWAFENYGCAGKYYYSWYMSLNDAYHQWSIP